MAPRRRPLITRGEALAAALIIALATLAGWAGGILVWWLIIHATGP